MGPHKSTCKNVQRSLVIPRSLLWSIEWEALVCVPRKQSSQMNMSVESVPYHIPLKCRCPDLFIFYWFRHVYLIYIYPDSLSSLPSGIEQIPTTVCIVLMIVPLSEDYVELLVFVFRTVSFSRETSIWWKQGLTRRMSRSFFWLYKENSVEISKIDALRRLKSS